MVLFKYWLKSYLKNVLVFTFALLFLFVMTTMTKYIDDWLLAAGKIADFVKIIIIFMPTAVKMILPAAAAMALVHTQRDFLDRNEWLAMKVNGLSLLHYFSWTALAALLVLIVMNLSIHYSSSSLVRHKILGISAHALLPSHLTMLKPGESKNFHQQHLLIYRDQKQADQFILVHAAPWPKEQTVVFGHGAVESGYFPQQMTAGKLYVFHPKTNQFSMAGFDELHDFLPRVHVDNMSSVVKRLFGQVFASNFYSYACFLLVMLGFGFCCPFVESNFGRVKSSIFLLFSYGFYFSMLRLAIRGKFFNFLPSLNPILTVHLIFIVLLLLLALLHSNVLRR